MLQKGSSEPWPDTLEAMTGSRKMDASAVKEYFKPLIDWLDQEINDKSIPVGWTEGKFMEWMAP